MRRPRWPAAMLLLMASALRAGEAWRAPAEERARTSPVPPSEAALAKGHALYQRHCQSCHGGTGKGDGKAAGASPRPPGDLTDQRDTSEGEIFWKVSRGLKEGGEVVMPRFDGEITNADDRWKLVLYVRTLGSPKSP